MSSSRKRRFSIRMRMRSFAYAFNGLRVLLCTEHNAWIHLGISVAVVAAGFAFGISPKEWIAVVFAIGLVFAAEIVNSSIEYLADRISTDHDEIIGKAKDLAAAAVLVAAAAAVVVGAIIFMPHILSLL